MYYVTNCYIIIFLRRTKKMENKQGNQNGQGGQNNYDKPKWGMKFHKMFIYFGVWLAVALNIYNGFSLISGRVYGEDEYLVYKYFSGLKVVDIIYGLICFSVAVLCVFTWYFLKNLRMIGCKLLLIMQIVNLSTLWLYTFVAGSITGSYNWLGLIIQTIAYFAIIMYTYNYYENRRDMFTY